MFPSNMLLLTSLLLTNILVHGAPVHPLCTPPLPDADDVYIDCEIETNDSGSSAEVPPYTGTLNVVEYNIDRNGSGGDGSRESGLSPILALLSDVSLLPSFDILVLSEVSRGCDNWAEGANGAEAIQEHFESVYGAPYHYAYTVEYINVDSPSSIGECSIGNAIVSRYPLSNVDQLTYGKQCCRYGGRWGGRSAVKAEVGGGEGEGKKVVVVSTHLESGQSDLKSVINGTYVRERQAAEITKAFPPTPDALTLIGGDFNSPLRSIDPTRLSFLHHDFHDSHDSMGWRERNTCPDGAIAQYAKALTLDFIYTSREEAIKEVGICDDEDKCNGWSDHVPIYATYAW